VGGVSNADSHEVAIVGGGISGLSIAWHLAARIDGGICVYDGAGIGSGATAIQPGGVRQQWATRLTSAMSREAYSFYSDVDALLEPAVSPGLTACGYLFVAEDEQELRELADRVAMHNELGIPSRMLDADQAAAIVPGLDPSPILGGSWCDQDGYFDRPQAVVAGFAASCERRGVGFETTDVTRLERDGDGWRLTLAGGAHRHASCVVLAASHRGLELLQPLAVELPIGSEARYLFYSDPIRERLLEPLVVIPKRHFAAKQLADGSVLASDLDAVGDPRADKSGWHTHIRESITEFVPVLEYVSFPVMVEGFYDVTPDHQPVLGPIDGQDGLWIAAGMNGRGFMLAPVIGRMIADGIAMRTFDATLTRLRPSRFAENDLVPEQQVV
jgi:sarcosine oxidase subunit beta